MPTTKTGPILTSATKRWSMAQWLEAYPSGPGREILNGAGPDGLLPPGQVLWCLQTHRIHPRRYSDALARCGAAGHPCLPMRHAGQLVVWLGY